MMKKLVEQITLTPDQLKKGGDFKVSPEVIQLIYADEISYLLRKLVKNTEIQTPVGATFEKEYAVTWEGVIIYPPIREKKFHKVVVKNTGSETLYVSTNLSGATISVEAGTGIRINPNKGVIEFVRLETDFGKQTTAKVIALY